MKTFHIHHRITKRDSALDKYFQQVERIPRLSRHQEEEIYKRLPAKEARDKLVRHNLRFAISVAKGYNIPGTELLDLIQECNIGLAIAAEKFKPQKGHKFISYAVWWCQQKCLEYIKNNSLIMIPADIERARTILRKLVESESPMYEDEICEKFKIRETTLMRLRQGTFDVLSIDAPVYDDDAEGFHIHDEPDMSSDKNEHLKRIVKAGLSRLNDRELKVIELYYGFNGKTPRGLLEIGEELGCTRELVRQIKNKAEKKISKTLQNIEIFA